MNGLPKAIAAWTRILGASHVITNKNEIDLSCRDITLYEPKASAILRPADRKEVQEILKIAGRFEIPVYPVSRGRNWGYGAACPFQAGQVVIDLSRLDRVFEINEKQGYAIIGPGVTQGQLSRHLKEHNSRFIIDVTGAPPEASVIGNILERGIGFGRHCDHFSSCCGFEIVLADGEVMKTGFGHFKEAANAHVHKNGIGPSLDGLFTQSSFGIVTQMTVWLAKKPDACEAFFFEFDSRQEMLRALDVFHDLKREGTLDENIHIANAPRVRSISPTAQARAWSGSGALSGAHEVVKAKKQRVRSVLKNGRLRWLTEKKLKWAARFPTFIEILTGRKAENIFPLLNSTFAWVNGIPSSIAVEALYAYLHRKVENKTNPINDGCGYYWFSPVIPWDSHIVDHALRAYERLFAKWGFSFDVTLQLPTEQAVLTVISIGYDKTDAPMSRKAKQCYDDLIKTSLKMGLYPYRTGTQTMNKFVAPQDPFWKTIRKIKGALDPKNIIAPGKWALPS